MTTEQEALIRKAHDSLRAARLLEADGLYDFAASRTYYSMFYIASALLLGKGLRFSKHASLISAFGLHLIRSGELDAKFHRYLIDAEDNRIAGDYSTQSNLTRAKVVEMISQGEEFIALAEEKIGPLPPANDPPQDGES